MYLFKIEYQNMFFWILKTSILCILIIFIIHHLFLYFQEQFSVPKIKDFSTVSEKYENMLRVLEEEEEKEDIIKVTQIENHSTFLENLPSQTKETEENYENMKEELKNYIKNEL